MTFEQSAKRLAEIVEKLESGEVSLEEGTKLFEEGVALVKTCHESIDKSKGKIISAKEELEKIINESEGE